MLIINFLANALKSNLQGKPMGITKKVMSLASISSLLVLAACSSDSKNEGLTQGAFKSAYDTGVFYSTDLEYSYQEYGINGEYCGRRYNDYYFESDTTLVFGDDSLPESDFKQAATWIEESFDFALSAMEVTKSEYFNSRNQVRLAATKYLISELRTKGYEAVEYPESYSDWSNTERANWATETAKSMDTEQIVALLINDPFSPYSTPEEIILEDKIYVCLRENNNTSDWAEGNLMGITIGADSVYTPKNVEQSIRHELIHTIQHALTANFETLGLPYWFSEGQAVLLSGMEIAKLSEQDDYDPVLVVDYYDEYEDSSFANKHYGLAYQYLKDANSQAAIIDMMKDIKTVTYYSTEQDNSDNEEFYGYVEMFNAQMKLPNGDPLTVKDYRNYYHFLLDDDYTPSSN